MIKTVCVFSSSSSAVIARTAQNHGARVTGVIPQQLVGKGIAYQAADELIISNNLRDRKEIIESKFDAFIALPGGFGTLEEIIEIHPEATPAS